MTLFRHGVATGDPDTDRVVIWTRVSPDDATDSIELGWTVTSDYGLRSVVARGTALARSGRSVDGRTGGAHKRRYLETAD